MQGHGELAAGSMAGSCARWAVRAQPQARGAVAISHESLMYRNHEND